MTRYYAKEWRKELTIDKTKLKRRAEKNPSTLNPGTILLTKSINTAFITKVKSPKVRIFRGRVKSSKIGLINMLIAPRTTATMRAVINPSTLTPGRIYALITTARALTIKLTNNIFL